MNTDLPVPVTVFDFLVQYTSLRMFDSSKQSNNKLFTSASKVCSQMLYKKKKITKLKASHALHFSRCISLKSRQDLLMW